MRLINWVLGRENKVTLASIMGSRARLRDPDGRIAGLLERKATIEDGMRMHSGGTANSSVADNRQLELIHRQLAELGYQSPQR